MIWFYDESITLLLSDSYQLNLTIKLQYWLYRRKNQEDNEVALQSEETTRHFISIIRTTITLRLDQLLIHMNPKLSRTPSFWYFCFYAQQTHCSSLWTNDISFQTHLRSVYLRWLSYSNSEMSSSSPEFAFVQFVSTSKSNCHSTFSKWSFQDTIKMMLCLQESLVNMFGCWVLFKNEWIKSQAIWSSNPSNCRLQLNKVFKLLSQLRIVLRLYSQLNSFLKLY